MSWRLRTAFGDEVLVVLKAEAGRQDAARRVQSLFIRAELRTWLLGWDGTTRRQLLEMHREVRGHPVEWRLRSAGDSLGHVHRDLDEAFENERLVAFKLHRPEIPADFMPPPVPEPEPEPSTTTWVAVKVVDDNTGQPIANVQLPVEVPGGAKKVAVTDGEGVARIDGIEEGSCSVSTDITGAQLTDTWSFVGLGEKDAAAKGTAPSGSNTRRRLALVSAHHVKSGETVDSLATDAGLTWQELAKFNFGTSVPKQINEHLRDEVGCTKKTADGYNYIFDDDDDPGIIYIPRPWTTSGLATGRTHVVRVAATQGFRVILETKQGTRLPHVKVHVTTADGVKRTVTSGKGGVALVANPPPGPVQVQYDDQDDIKAKALAAAARQAFDTRATAEIYRVLKHSPPMVRKVVEAYDKYFNTYHGKGLVEDIYAEFTDPQALRVVVGLLARAGIATREHAVYVPRGQDQGEHRIVAAPSLRAVVPGSEVSYACAAKHSAFEAPGAGYEYEWYCLNDRGSVEQYGVPQVKFGPQLWRWDKAKWSTFGDHAVVCRVQYHDASGNRHPPTYYEYAQAVESAEAVLGERLQQLSAADFHDPHQALSAVNRYLGLLEDGEKYASSQGLPPLPHDKQAEYDKHKEDIKNYRDKLNEKVGGENRTRFHFPFKSAHLETTTTKMTTLRVCMRVVREGMTSEWELVDWTHPAVRALTGVYGGSGSSTKAAILDAIKAWDTGFNGNAYPDGLMKYELSPSLVGEVMGGQFKTTGNNTLGAIATFFTYVGAAAGILALVLAPIPGSSLAAGALYVAVFTSTAAAAINIGQRYHEGFSNWQDDSIDALTIVSNCFGFGWLRGAQLSRAGKTFFLIGRVAADAAQGVLVTQKILEEYEGIMKDTSLSPEDRSKRLLALFGQAAATGAMFYLNVKGTKADVQQLNAGGGKTRAKLSDLADKGKTLELDDKLPALEGHTDDKIKKTTVETEAPRQHPISETKGPPPWPKENEEIWETYKVEDDHINLTTKDGFWFRASINSHGYVDVDVHLRDPRTDARSRWKEELGSGKTNYKRMFAHFESKNLPIRGWEGVFIDDNYTEVKKFLANNKNVDPKEAVFNSKTGKDFWKPWADSKRYKCVVEEGKDYGGFFGFSVRFEPGP